MRNCILTMLMAGLTLAGSSLFAQTVKINNLTIEVVEGDVTAQRADGIIVSHFPDKISPTTGAALLLSRKGGNDALIGAEAILRDGQKVLGQVFLTSTTFLRAKILNA